MGKPNILVVEDEDIVALDIKNRLTRLGYVVVTLASTGEEAVRKTIETQPDLVLMDIKLTGELDGVEAVEQIRASFNVPVIYLTAYADEYTLQRAKVTEPNGYILKPFQDGELHTTIEMALYRHKTERKLKEREQWLNTILESIGDGVIVTDTRGRITFMNSVAEHLTGWQREAALNADSSEVLNLINEETKASVKNPIHKVLQEGSIVELAESILLVSRNGTRKSVAETVAPLRDGAGNVTGVVVVFRDITEHRRIEKRIQQQERLAAVGQLAAGIAHDFNNILTGIIGFADLLRVREDVPETATRSLERIIHQGQQGAKLIGQILDFSRQNIPKKYGLDLAPFLKETVKLLERIIPENIRISLEIDPEHKAYMLNADAMQLQQAITNLAVNARDAMPGGGILKLRLSAFTLEPDQHPPCPSLQPGDWIILTVSDSGVGVPVEHQTYIFEPFFTTKKGGQGIGLGLAQVYGIVKQHHGDITLNSQVDKGTTFTLYLPQLSAFKEEPFETQSPAIQQGNGEVILLVEDDRIVLGVAEEILKHLNYQVLTATNGREALMVFERHKDEIVLVLTDVTMPELGGMALAQILRERDPAVKVLALSGYPVEELSTDLINLGIVGWLQKPLDVEKLAQEVSRALRM